MWPSGRDQAQALIAVMRNDNGITYRVYNADQKTIVVVYTELSFAMADLTSNLT